MIVDLIDDLEAHLAGGAGDDAEAGFVVARVQVFRFRFHGVDDFVRFLCGACVALGRKKWFN